jgi:HEAT repeat protein
VYQALEGIKDPAVIPVLARRLIDPQDHGRAGSALARRGEQAEAEVLKYATHEDRRVRQQVLNILRRIATQESVPALKKMASSDPDRGIQLSAQSILRRLGSGR